MDSEKKANLILWTVTGLVSVAVFCIIEFAIIRNYAYLGAWSNSFFITGVIVVGSGLLYLMARAGTFDIFVYGFSDVVYHMNPKPKKEKKYADYPAYVNAKREERSQNKGGFLPFIVIGGFFLLLGVLFRLLLLLNSGV